MSSGPESSQGLRVKNGKGPFRFFAVGWGDSAANTIGEQLAPTLEHCLKTAVFPVEDDSRAEFSEYILFSSSYR